MKRFKLKIGKNNIYDINKETFEEKTKKQEPYIRVGKDKEKRCFAICPACDNPIQIIGLYKSIKVKPYGKHYNRSVEKLAVHNEQAYQFCPYASHIYSSVDKNRKKKEFTEYEARIYNLVRDNFDKALYILKKDTGIHFTPKLAEKILFEYTASEGWMYPLATIYNIPWMLMYFAIGVNPYGWLIEKNSKLYKYLQTNKNIRLVEFNKNLVKIDTNSFIKMNYMFTKHRRTIINDEVIETIEVNLDENISKNPDEREWKFLWKDEIQINEHRFLNFVVSIKTEEYRNKKLLDIAEKIMPDIKSQAK